MRHRADQLAVLHYRAAAHALHYATGEAEQLIVRDADHHVLSGIGAHVQLLYLYRITVRAAVVQRAVDLSLADGDLAVIRAGYALALRRCLVYAVHSVCVVHRDRADLIVAHASVQASRHAGLSLGDRAYLGADDPAAPQREQQTRVAVVDTVAERAEGAGALVIVGHRTQTRGGVAHPHTHRVAAVVVGARSNAKGYRALTPRQG